MNYLKRKLKKMEDRISKQELMKMYKVNRSTIEEWRRRFGLPMIEISTHKKYIRREDLLRWENQMKEGQCELELTISGV